MNKREMGSLLYILVVLVNFPVASGREEEEEKDKGRQVINICLSRRDEKNHARR